MYSSLETIMRTFLFIAMVLSLFLTTGCHRDEYIHDELERVNPAQLLFNKQDDGAKIIATSSSYINIHLETSGIIQWGDYVGSSISVIWDAKFQKSIWITGQKKVVSGDLTILIEGQRPIHFTKTPLDHCIEGWYLYTDHDNGEEHLDYIYRGPISCMGINRPFIIGIYGHQAIKKGGIEQVQIYMRPENDADPNNSIFWFSGVPSEFRVY